MSPSPDQESQSLSQFPTSQIAPEIFTPTTSVVGDVEDSTRAAHRPPIPGKTYIIRCLADYNQITLLGGQVVLAEADSLGSPYWHCVENNGWLGFRNTATNRFLGHDGQKPGDLICVAERQREWEWFQVDQHRSMLAAGGYALRVEYWAGLRSVGAKVDGGQRKLERIKEQGDHGLVWVFEEAF